MNTCWTPLLQKCYTIVSQDKNVFWCFARWSVAMQGGSLSRVPIRWQLIVCSSFSFVFFAKTVVLRTTLIFRSRCPAEHLEQRGLRKKLTKNFFIDGDELQFFGSRALRSSWLSKPLLNSVFVKLWGSPRLRNKWIFFRTTNGGVILTNQIKTKSLGNEQTCNISEKRNM